MQARIISIGIRLFIVITLFMVIVLKKNPRIAKTGYIVRGVKIKKIIHQLFNGTKRRIKYLTKISVKFLWILFINYNIKIYLNSLIFKRA